jgi:ABC-type transporter Mla subunit MlaD
MPMTEEQSREWHLDRKFSIGLVATIIAQTVGIVWWASALSTTVAELRTIDQKHDASISALSTAKETTSSRVTGLEVSVTAIISNLNRIEGKLDRLIEEKRQ